MAEDPEPILRARNGDMDFGSRGMSAAAWLGETVPGDLHRPLPGGSLPGSVVNA